MLDLLAADAIDVFSTVRDGGVIGLLLVILVGGVKGWWVFGWMYRDLKADAEEWKRQALRGAANAEKATSLAEAITNAIETEASKRER